MWSSDCALKGHWNIHFSLIHTIGDNVLPKYSLHYGCIFSVEFIFRNCTFFSEYIFYIIISLSWHAAFKIQFVNVFGQILNWCKSVYSSWFQWHFIGLCQLKITHALALKIMLTFSEEGNTLRPHECISKTVICL